MPINRASLGVTEHYRSQSLLLRRHAQIEAAAIWNRVDPRALDHTYDLPRLVESVSKLQRQGVILSGAYLHAYIRSELGEDVVLQPLDMSTVGRARSGAPLSAALLSPLIDVKVATREGEPIGASMARARRRLLRIVGVATDNSTREALRMAMVTAPEVIGWRRAVHGTCDVCVGAAQSSTLPAGTPLEIHPNCECVSEAVVRPPPPSVALKSRSMGDVTYGGAPNAPYTKADAKAVNDYVGTAASEDINAYLRGQSKRVFTYTDAELRQKAKALDIAMDRRGGIGKPVEVFRGLSGTAKDFGFEEGRVITDLGFGSTTEDIGRAESVATHGGFESDTVTLTLSVDKRVKAIWGANPDEEEMVLQRSCRYKIRSVKKVGDTWQVQADVLPPLGRVPAP